MVVSMVKGSRVPTGLHFDPVQDVIDFIRNCRHHKMNKTKTIGAVMDQLHYLPCEADIIVNEFWDRAS